MERVKMVFAGFPGGSVVKNSPANAGDRGSISDPGRSKMPRIIRPVGHNYWACTLEFGSCSYWSLRALESVLHSKRNHCNEKPVYSLSGLSGQEFASPCGGLKRWGSTPGWERSSREGNGNSLRYSCLKNSMDRGTWWATVMGVAKSWTGLNTHPLT